jgi:glutamate dehydrogenase/leucine dehydrogenase
MGTETSLFTQIESHGHEGLLTVQDAATGLRGYIGLHNTTLGPGLGGCRMMRYADEAAALKDALSLSEAMTYKNALAGLQYGGGKGVIWLQPGQEKTPELVKAFAKRIDLLKGAYYTATDIGSTSDDMVMMKTITPYVSALPPEQGGLGDSAILTGLGVYMGMKAAVKHRLGKDSLKGLRIAIQGAGKVAWHMLNHLRHEEDVTLYITDTQPAAIERCKALVPHINVVASEEIWHTPVDVLSPNAIGGTITQAVLESTQAKIVAGGANNPLEHKALAEVMQQKGILFAPDFAINSGGVIVLSTELAHGTLEAATEKTNAIYDTALRVFDYAERHQLNTLAAAIALAKQRIAEHHTNQTIK